MSFFLILALFPILYNAEETQIMSYVGPYKVTFNDSHNSEQSSGSDLLPNSCMNGYMLNQNETSIIGFYTYQSSRNDLLISIMEDRLEAEKELLVVVNPPSIALTLDSNSTIIGKLQRRIAGQEGATEIAQYETGQIIRRGTFMLKSKTSCDDMTNGKLAIVQISCLDYTEDEFDRILDTFEIERLLDP